MIRVSIFSTLIKLIILKSILMTIFFLRCIMELHSWSVTFLASITGLRLGTILDSLHTREMHHENFSNVAWVIKKMCAVSSYIPQTIPTSARDTDWMIGRAGMVLWIGHASEMLFMNFHLIFRLWILSFFSFHFFNNINWVERLEL